MHFIFYNYRHATIQPGLALTMLTQSVRGLVAQWRVPFGFQFILDGCADGYEMWCYDLCVHRDD